MSNKSIKLKMTFLVTMLLFFVSMIFLVVQLGISKSILKENTKDNLTKTVTDNFERINGYDEKGRLSLSKDFIYSNGQIQVCIYNNRKALLAGDLMVDNNLLPEFENGIVREYTISNKDYYIVDIYYPFDWDNGIWLRGITEFPDFRRMLEGIGLSTIIILPLFVTITGISCFLIIKNLLKPMDDIRETAESIAETGELNRRIGLNRQDELGKLSDTFDKMVEKLENSFEAEKRFASDASHELRTPVAIIKSACEYSLKYDESREEFQESLGMISRQNERMNKLINTMLTMTRLEQGTEKVKFEKIHIGNLLEDIVRDYLQDKSDPINITFERNEDIVILGDEGLLKSLVVNLIGNSKKYSRPEEKTHIWVEALKSDNEVLVKIKDNGLGIPQDKLNKIWKRFYRMDDARSEEVEGTGLGLSLVEQIARLHGGYMSVGSLVGLGSEFVLHLPIKQI